MLNDIPLAGVRNGPGASILSPLTTRCIYLHYHSLRLLEQVTTTEGYCTKPGTSEKSWTWTAITCSAPCWLANGGQVDVHTVESRSSFADIERHSWRRAARRSRTYSLVLFNYATLQEIADYIDLRSSRFREPGEQR